MKNIIKDKFQLFVALSSIFVCTMIVVYGYRFIHYYKLEQAENEKLETTVLNEKLKLSKEVLIDNDLYYFEKNPKNNYIWYSGILWRIIDFNDEYVRVISNDTLTSLVHKYTTDWLETTFKSNLNKEFLYDENISLLSKEDYQKYGEKSSYLNNRNYFWTNNKDEENIYFINVNGEVDSNLINSDTNYSYGIRPVIKLKSNVNFKSGDGSITKPFTLVDRNILLLSDINVGEYISYSNYIWRVVSKGNDKIKIVLNGVIEENNEKLEQPFSSYDNVFNVYDGIGYYLNNDFYNSLNNKEYIISSNWDINSYSYENNYDYQEINDTINTNIGLLSIGEMFTSSYSNYHLLTTFNEYENTIYIQDEYSVIFADIISSNHNIRPSLYLKNNLKIMSGTGTENSPYELGNVGD